MTAARREVPPVRLVPRFARQRRAAGPCPGADRQCRPVRAALRVVSAVLLTCEDVIARARADGAGRGVGLRGGAVTVTAAPPGYHLALHQLRWTQDVAVSGELDWPGRSGTVHATVELVGPDRDAWQARAAVARRRHPCPRDGERDARW